MIDEKLIRFIREHHVLTLATCANGQPYCCSCFYAYNEEQNIFVVKTNDNTRHNAEIEANPQIGASIVLETKEIGKIQGLQLTGRAVYYHGDQLGPARKTYLKQYPYAIASPGEYLAIEPDFMKLTDNRFGFGKKLIWRAGENGEQIKLPDTK